MLKQTVIKEQFYKGIIGKKWSFSSNSSVKFHGKKIWKLQMNVLNLSEAIRAVTWDFQLCGMCEQQSLRSACAYVQSDLRLCWSLEYSMSVKLLTEHYLKFLSLKGGCTGLSESALVKMPHYWKSHARAQIIMRCVIKGLHCN